MGYGIWDMGYGTWELGYSYRFGHPRYRYEIWDIDRGDEGIHIVIPEIDMGYGISIHWMTESILSCWIMTCDVLSLWRSAGGPGRRFY